MTSNFRPRFKEIKKMHALMLGIQDSPEKL